MGKFTNTSYANTINNLVDAGKSRLDNPYYIFSDKKPTETNYYRQNKEASTLDDGSKTYYDPIGFTSPIKYDLIKGLYLYGIDKIALDYTLGDFGLESGPIEGDAIVLPNTITPMEGDLFVIKHIKEDLFFRVNQVTPDTLDSGANIYKFNYSLFREDTSPIVNNINKTYVFIVNNVGTDFSTVLQEESFKLIGELENIQSNLISYYEELFFDPKVQTFTFRHGGVPMYDPYLIEFLRKNDVLNSGDKYIYVAHQCATEKTFSLIYNKTFFNNFEEQSIKFIDTRINAVAREIDDINSLFVTRVESFFRIEYGNAPFSVITRLQTLKSEAIQMVLNNSYADAADPMSIYNLWVAYFNNNKDYIDQNIVDILKNFDFHDNIDCYYAIPLNIYILGRYIQNVMS